MNKLHKLLFLAILTAFSLIIYILEAQIPIFISIPGVKLGLSNVITLVALLLFSVRESLVILLLRCFLGAVLSGQLAALPYSLIGGVLSLIVMAMLRNHFSQNQIFILSVIGAVFHNFGQILTAAVITETKNIFLYFPVLLLSGIITGMFTGFVVQYLLPYLKKIQKKAC